MTQEARNAGAGSALGGKIAIVIALAAAIGGVAYLKARQAPRGAVPAPVATPQARALPRLVDLGAGTCIPCKMMAPILDELKKEYAGKFDVLFIDVWENPDEKERYGIRLIPTQIFYDASGRELFRHEGFFSRDDILGKWKELGFDFGEGGEPKGAGGLVRGEPLAKDTRAPETICSMCGGTIDLKPAVAVDASWGKARLCSVHCLAIYYSSLRDPEAVAGKVLVTCRDTGNPVALERAFFAHAAAEGERPVIQAFGEETAASRAAAALKGRVMSWGKVLDAEQEARCGFCGRVVYPQDAATVCVLEKVASCCGEQTAVSEETWGCCPMCALGVAAGLKKDIAIEQKCTATGKPLRVQTADFKVVYLDPPTAVAWHGQRKSEEGKMASAGCFHQFFFVGEPELRKWLQEHPLETGRMMTIQQALDAKLKLSAEQIENACKIGDCK